MIHCITIYVIIFLEPPATKKFEAKITLQEIYQSAYNDTNSAEYKNFTSNFTSKVGTFFRDQLSDFKHVVVNKLSKGSVVVDFDIVVQQSSNATVNIIVNALNASNSAQLGYTLVGPVNVKLFQEPASTTSTSSATATGPGTDNI